MDWIKPLSELTLSHTEQVGSKAAHLGAMLRAGFNVPEGFVITVDAFADHFGQITDPLVKPVTPRLSADLMAEVVTALTENLGRESEVAVRSSSTEEDLSFASFAGQHSTYYFVPPTNIDQAIIDCWMSLWSNAALAYRRSGAAAVESGIPLRMAVIVQRMVPATRSGVVFSKDPATARNDIVVEACWGLGAALVDGHANPDLARLDEEGRLLDYRIRDKRVQVLPGAHNSDAKRLQSLPEALRGKAVLDEAEVEHIANLALQLETLFESPQDIEWSYEGDELCILQSRPITTRHEVYPYDDKLVVFKPVAENFGEPLTPLAEDIFATALPKVGVMFTGRLYLDFEFIQRLVPFKMSDAELANLLLLRPTQETSSEGLRIHWPGLLRSICYGTALFLVDGANWIRAGHMQQQDLERYAAFAERTEADRGLSLESLIRRLVWASHSFAPAYHQMFMLNISAARYFLLIAWLERLVAKFAPDFPLAELPKTYHGRSDMQSLEMLDSMRELSRLLYAQPDLLERVRAGEVTLPVGHPFTVAFGEFLSRHGHRGAKEIDIAAPRWREQPGMLLSMLAETPPRSNNRVYGELLAARDQLNTCLKPWQRWLIDRVTRSISHFIALRENTRHHHVLAFDQMRKRVLSLERELIHDGALIVPGDIFFLTSDEIEALEQHTLTPPQAHELIRGRRRERALFTNQGYADTINIEMAPAVEADPDSRLLIGICASPGYTEGIARIVHNPAQAHNLGADDILVAPHSDPAWTPLFVRASGAIIANGSFLSHAGTVARELHLPCLVEVPSCTQRIAEGQRLRLNASAGTVELLD